MTTSHYRPGAAGTAGSGFRVPRPRSGDEEGAGSALSASVADETGPSGVSAPGERTGELVANVESETRNV